MRIHVRRAIAADAHAVVGLLEAHLRETFDVPCPVTVDAFVRDGFGARFELVVAHDGERLVGFTAWERAYDLHHGVHGANVLDMYVVPAVRAQGVAPSMLALVAREVLEAGGSFLRGQAIATDDRPLRLYRRVAVAFPGTESIVGGRAFRALAALAGTDRRAFVRALPRHEWNFEP